jgi:hypothetical protein
MVITPFLVFFVAALLFLWTLTAKVLYIKVILTTFFAVWLIGGKFRWTHFNTPENGNKCLVICIIASLIAISCGVTLGINLSEGTNLIAPLGFLNSPLGLFVSACIFPGAYINYKFGPTALGTFYDLERERIKEGKRKLRTLKAFSLK